MTVDCNEYQVILTGLYFSVMSSSVFSQWPRSIQNIKPVSWSSQNTKYRFHLNPIVKPTSRYLIGYILFITPFRPPGLVDISTQRYIIWFASNTTYLPHINHIYTTYFHNGSPTKNPVIKTPLVAKNEWPLPALNTPLVAFWCQGSSKDSPYIS